MGEVYVDGNFCDVATPEPHDALRVPLQWPLVRRGLRGVAAATRAGTGDIEATERALFAVVENERATYDHRSWFEKVDTTKLEGGSRTRLRLAITLALICHCGREHITLSSGTLDYIWSVLRDSLLDDTIHYTISRSAQGLIAVPLWSMINGGSIEELIRFHIWLPDSNRGIADLAIHAHQPFAQSWTLAGEGVNVVYHAESATPASATHAEYAVSWISGNAKQGDTAYKTHQSASTVANTGKLVQVNTQSSELHSRDMMYTVAAGVLHKSDIEPDALRATLFIFDSARGFQSQAPVLGPINGEHYTQTRAAQDTTVRQLVSAVDCMRAWELSFAQGLGHCQAGHWEEALRALRNALHNVEENSTMIRYKRSTLGEIGHAYRMLGKYDLACQTLENCIRDMPWTKDRIKMVGELGATYNLMARLEDAKLACEDEYAMAKKLGLDTEACRAIGNLGMINFELYQRDGNTELLDLAIIQLKERIDLARKLKAFAPLDTRDEGARASLVDFASQREAIALARLSLCYSEKRLVSEAISAAHKSLEVTLTQRDPTKTAFSRYFYGRALLLAGKESQALQQFNPNEGCTPVIALCREPAKKHRDYIQEMIDAGADLELRDEQGYSALDCAVYNGDVETQKVIENGLKVQYDRRLERLGHEAMLRKSYRGIIQDVLRPILLRHRDTSALSKLRASYASALQTDLHQRLLLDVLKYIPYIDFLQAGQIPRSNAGLTRQYSEEHPNERGEIFVVFMSYRWIAKDPRWIAKTDSPDDVNNTQYRRMVRAIEDLLRGKQEVRRESVRVWIVSCVNSQP